MSVINFESLPDTVLYMICENYLDMNDALKLENIGNFNLHRIVKSCQKFSLDLFACSRNYFSYYFWLLQKYKHKIWKLRISDHFAPDQTTLFAGSFSKFTPLSKLKQLDISINQSVLAISLSTSHVNSLLQSLVELKSLETVSLQIFNSGVAEVPSVFLEIWFRCRGLKRLSLDFDFPLDDLSFLEHVSTNLQHLSIVGFCVPFVSVGNLLKSSPSLRYLNVEVGSTVDSFILNQLSQHTNLQTLNLSFNFSHPELLQQVTWLLSSLANLRRLTIRGKLCLMNAYIWQAFIEENNRIFERFQLDWLTDGQKFEEISAIMDSFETEFWINMNNFYFTYRETRILSTRREMNLITFKDYLYKYNSVPFRSKLDAEPFKFIRNLLITNTLLQRDYHRFINVESLLVENLTEEILAWLPSHVDQRNVREIDLRLLVAKTRHIILFLELFPSVESLIIGSFRNDDENIVFGRRCQNVRFLTVLDSSSLRKDTISTLFPNLRHLIVTSPIDINLPRKIASVTVCDSCDIL